MDETSKPAFLPVCHGRASRYATFQAYWRMCKWSFLPIRHTARVPKKPSPEAAKNLKI
jgi:hypothetical protein